MTDRVHFDDLTKIDVELGRLDDDTYFRLRAHDGPIEYKFYKAGTFSTLESPRWYIDNFYRAKPQPLTKPQVPDDLWRLFPDWVESVAKDTDDTIILLSCAVRVSAWGEWWDAPKTIRLRGWNIDPGTCDWRDSLVKRPEAL